jgi:serine/threonine-protein kinase
MKKKVLYAKLMEIKEICESLEISTKCLRSEPKAVSKKKARKEFRLDKGRRPLEFIKKDFEDKGEVIIDHANELMWQKAGSSGLMSHSQAQEYIKDLNKEQFVGHDNWRLPTIPELMSLLEPQKQSNNLYINPIFKTREYEWVWSADIVKGGSSSAAWAVYFNLGYVYCSGVNCILYVRAVRSC